MDCYNAVDEILDIASGIRLPDYRINVVAAARREFAKNGCCNTKLIDPIEKTMRECLKRWSVQQKRTIWESTEFGAGEEFESYDLSSIEMDLEGELMHLILEELSPSNRLDDSKDSDES